MKPRVSVISGGDTVGGNCIAVSLNRDEYVVLDHGLRFDVLGKYYGFYVQPLSADELRELGALPPLDVVAGAREVYISHLHLDHIGSLDYLDLMGLEKPSIYVPMRDYYADVLMEKWRYSWKSVLVPHLPSSKNRLGDPESHSKHVTPVKVFHSAYPSYAYVVETDEGVVAYTGDLRFKSLVCHDAEEDSLMGELCSGLYGEEGYDPLGRLADAAGRPDVLVVEGTNIGRLVTPLEPRDFVEIIRRVLSRGSAVVSLHTLDLESLLAISAVAKELGLATYLYGARLATYVSSTGLKAGLLEELGIAYAEKKPLPTINIEGVSLETALRDLLSRSALIITDYETVDVVRAIRKQSPVGRVSMIFVVSEPQSEEYSAELESQLAWLQVAGIQPYRVRVSGHYYPYELERVLSELRPKAMIPVHTNSPDLMAELHARLAAGDNGVTSKTTLNKS